jgi:hypothetical protein
MELRLSLVLLAVLLLLGSAMSASSPSAVYSVDDPEIQGLAAIEDSLAHDRGNVELARELTSTYLRLGQPGLAIAAVRAAPVELGRDAILTHRLAQAYEASGRVDDALATAQLARARCACTLRDGATCTELPRCTHSTLAALEMHEEALSALARWGVTDPRHDTRTGLAYKLARRTARIASLGTGITTAW